MSLKVIAIAAMASNRAIGFEGQMPWHLPEDLKRFSELTTKHAVLMGRKTFDSLPERFRPLPRRENYVVTRHPGFLRHTRGIRLVTDVEQFIKDCKEGKQALPSDKLWIIGGAEIYRLTQPFWDEIYLTKIDSSFEGDAFFPEFEEDYTLKQEETHKQSSLSYSFQHYLRNEINET